MTIVPGFIDCHNHAPDNTLLYDVIVGNPYVVEFMLIHQSVIAGSAMFRLRLQFRMGEVSEHSETIIRAHKHNSAARQSLAVEHGILKRIPRSCRRRESITLPACEN